VRPMRALVVYESQYGNTEHVARAIADGMRADASVDVVGVDDVPVPPLVDVDLLVVGGPTHVFSMSRPPTRADAGKDAPSATRTGIREWLAGARGVDGLRVATFDTRQGHSRLTGSAAAAAARAARTRGMAVIATMDFFVTGRSGPLEDGEQERAAAWGRALVRGDG